jgi:hypothetical protein
MGATLTRTTEEHQDVTVTNAGGHDGGATVDELQTNAVSSHSRRWAHAHVGHKPVGSGTSAPASGPPPRKHRHSNTLPQDKRQRRWKGEHTEWTWEAGGT